MTEDPNKDNQTPPPSDVLKKLKEVRRKLQESLSEGEEKVQPVKSPEKLDIIPGATETLARAAAEKERARLEKEMAAAEKEAAPAAVPEAPQRQLYKAGGEETSAIREKKMKVKADKKPKITAARLAAIQRRVRQKSQSFRTMGRGKRTALIIVLAFAFLPLIGSLQLNLIACEFKFDQFAIQRDQNAPAGEISISLPVHNPQFIPAFLGQLSLKIFDPAKGVEVLRAATVSTHMIGPYETIVLTLKATLNPDYAGDWLKGLLTTKMLNIQIKDLSYNGLVVPNEIIPVISLDISSLMSDLLGSMLDVQSLIQGLLGDLQKASDMSTADHIVRNLWAEALGAAIVKEANANGVSPNSAQSMDLLASLGLTGVSIKYLDVYETDTNFTVELTLGIQLPELLQGMNLGPIVMSYLNASLWTNNVDPVGVVDTTHTSKYRAEVARLELVPSPDVGDRNTLNNKDGKDDAAYIVLDGSTESVIAARLTIFKDNIGMAMKHPSANVDWQNATAVSQFAQQAKHDYPTWYFLYYLLANGSMDVYLNIARVDLEIFGIKINNLPLDILPPIFIDGLLNINTLLGSPFGLGFGPGIGLFIASAATGGLALPSIIKSRYKVDSNSRYRTAALNEDNLTDALMGMIDLNSLSLDLNMIHENLTAGTLSLGIALPINNTLFNIHAGLVDAVIRLGSKLPGEGNDVDPTFFAVLGLTSNGSNTIYLNGSTPPFCVTTIDANLTLYTNATMAPYAAQFIRKFIEEFTLDAYLNVHLGQLMLFKENMTLQGIDITLPLTLDLSSMVNDLISSMVGSLISQITGMLTGSSSNSTGASIGRALSNPLAAPYALPFVLTDPFAATALGQPRPAQLENIFGSDVGFTFDVSSNPVYTSIDLAISGLFIDMHDLGIPISIGLGYSTFSILGAVPNQFGGIDWHNMVEMKIDNYIDLASTEPQSIIAHLRVYESTFSEGAICNFIDELVNNGTITMKLSGNTALNLSGIFLDDLNMNLELKQVDTGLNVTDLVNSLIGSLTGSTGGAADAPIDWGPVPAWWTGDPSSLPFMQPLTAQDQGASTNLLSSLDMFISIDTSMISITDISETDWPFKYDGVNHNGTVHLGLAIPITNHMMTIKIPEFSAVLYADPANTKVLARVSIDPNTAILRTNQQALLTISIDLIKSQDLENWLNNLLQTFTIEGYLSLNVSLGVFGCTVGPLSINNLSLASLGLTPDMLTGLLNAVNPLDSSKGNPLQVIGNNPNAAQIDIMSLIGKFGLAWVEIAPARWDVGAWDKNQQYPMINVSLGIALQPAFNMSIDTADHNPNTSDLQLCDSTIFKAIYDLPTDAPKDVDLWNKAVMYSKVADIFIRNTPVYFNNTYDGSAGQDNNFAIDPHKPYFLNNTALTRAATCQPSYDEAKATGDYTWDLNTPSNYQASIGSGVLPVSSPLGYRTEAYGARSLRVNSAGTVPLKPTGTNLTGFWGVTFMARSDVSGSNRLYFYDTNMNYAYVPFTTTTTWTKYSFILPNFTVSGINWALGSMMYFQKMAGGYLYIDDLSISAPQVSSYISWGDAGALDNDPNMVKDSTFNFLEFNLLMYNISHPTFADAYPRELWRKLGGPFFSPIVYGKQYGGFPDHRVVYPAYFSPYANFLSGMVGLLGGALGGGDIASLIPALIGSIALNGSLKVNIFSMDLTIDVGLPVLGDLLASMGTLLGTTLYRVMDHATNPLSKGTPFPAQLDNLLGGLGSFPIIGLFYEIPIFGAAERHNSLFNPQYAPSTGSNIDPYDYYYQPWYNYHPGLATPENPNGMNTENFVKDAYYDSFKIYTENWAESIGIPNPYFESVHPLTGERYNLNLPADQKFDLRNPDSWPLKYNGNMFGGTGRVRTEVLDFLLGISLPLPVTVLGAYINFLFDSPYVPCGYAPGGYIWINESQYIPQGPGWKQADGSDYAPYLTPWNTKTSYPQNGQCGRDPRFAMYPSAQLTQPVLYNDNGAIIGSTPQSGVFQSGRIGNWMLMNIRLFEGAPVYDFLSTLINSMLGTISGVASVVSANASLFGYEVYNIGGLQLPLGDHSPSGIAFCNMYGSGASNGSSWNIPASNGTIVQAPPPEPTWPPALPGFTPTYYMSDTMYLSMNDAFGSLLNDLVGTLLSQLTADIPALISDILTLLLTGTLPFVTQPITINNPIPLPMWIKQIGVELSITLTQGGTPIDLGVTKTSNIWKEFDTYPGQQNNPYYFGANPLAQLAVYEPWTLPSLTLTVVIPGGIISLIGDLLGGGLSLGLTIKNILLYIAIPASWDYTFTLDAAALVGEGALDLGGLLGG